MKPIRTFGILAFKQTPEISAVLTRIYTWSQSTDAHVLFHPECTSIIDGKQVPVTKTEKEFLAKSQAIVSIGGDGTFLSAVHMTRFSKTPVAGVHLGGLGFLTDILPENIEQALSNIYAGKYRTNRRMLLEARVVRKNKEITVMHAVNDVFINRADAPRLVSVAAWHGNSYITDFRADGVIVATPSGSTAYSLAAGGPIVDPGVRAFLLNPICPHSLTQRPILLSSTKPIRFAVNPKSADVLLSADGRNTIKLTTGDQVIIRHGGFLENLIQLSRITYFDLLRSKLCWGNDFRNREEERYVTRPAHKKSGTHR